MRREEIENKIRDIIGKIAPETDPAILLPDANIQATLDVDSYDFLNLMIGISETCGVDIPEGEYGRLGTLEKITAYVLERI